MASILTVDDSSSLRQTVSFTLKSEGHDVTEAEDGQMALDIAREQGFDLVITDVNMPNMDGITLISELRKLPDFAGIPLFMLTTESAEDKQEAGKQAGATGWIFKPFKPQQLISLIKRALS